MIPGGIRTTDGHSIHRYIHSIEVLVAVVIAMFASH
jgi:hypothetical protein